MSAMFLQSPIDLFYGPQVGEFNHEHP